MAEYLYRDDGTLAELQQASATTLRILRADDFCSSTGF